MKHKALKKAVFRANLPDADVALRALDRIDKDDEFRDALMAVVDADDDDGAKLQKIIYSHFTPVQRSRTRTYRDKPAFTASQLDVTMSADEVLELINDQTIEALIHLLSNRAIEKRVERFIGERTEEIILALMGLEEDSFHRGSYRPRTDHKTMSKAGDMIRAKIDSVIGPVLQETVDKIDLQGITNVVLVHNGTNQIKEWYKSAVNDRFRSLARQRAEDRAHLDVDTYLRDFFEDPPEEKEEEDDGTA